MPRLPSRRRAASAAERSSCLMPPLCCYAFPPAARKASVAAHIIIIPQQPENTSPTNGFLISSLIFVFCALFLSHPEGNALIKPTGLRSAAAPQRARKAGSGRLFGALLSNGYIRPTGILPLRRPPLPALATRRVAAALLMSRSFAQRRKSRNKKKLPFPCSRERELKNRLSDYCQSDVMTGCADPRRRP